MPDGPVVDIDIRGAQRLARTLQGASEDLRSLDRAHGEAGAIAMAEAKSRAPRRTGRLAASGVLVRQDAGVGLSFTVPYAPPIHWGWRARGIAENPWVTKAAQATEPRWFKAYVDEVESELRKVQGA